MGEKLSFIDQYRAELTANPDVNLISEFKDLRDASKLIRWTIIAGLIGIGISFITEFFIRRQVQNNRTRRVLLVGEVVVGGLAGAALGDGVHGEFLRQQAIGVLQEESIRRVENLPRRGK